MTGIISVIKNYHNGHTKFGMIIVVILCDFHTLEFAVYHLVYEPKLNVNVFYDSQGMAISMLLAYQLCCLYDSSSKVCLIQTVQHNVVAILAYGWTFAGMDPILQSNTQ